MVRRWMQEGGMLGNRTLALGFAASLSLLAAGRAMAAEPGAEGAAHEADLVVTDARIYTARPQRDVAEAFAVTDGRIVFVGSATEAQAWIGPHTEVKRLGGKLVLPDSSTRTSIRSIPSRAIPATSTAGRRRRCASCPPSCARAWIDSSCRRGSG